MCLNSDADFGFSAALALAFFGAFGGLGAVALATLPDGFFLPLAASADEASATSTGWGPTGSAAAAAKSAISPSCT